MVIQQTYRKTDLTHLHMLQPQVGKTDARKTSQTLEVDAGRQAAETGDADVGQLGPLARAAAPCVVCSHHGHTDRSTVYRGRLPPGTRCVGQCKAKQ